MPTPANSADLELSIAPLVHGPGLSLRLMEPDIRHGPFPIALDSPALLEHTGDMAAYGAALRDMLFAEPAAREAFLACRAAGLSVGKRLRVRLLLPPDLHTLRWEALRDPHSGRGLARDGDLLLSRYLSSDDYTPLQLRPRGQLRALVAVAAPNDAQSYGLAPINAEDETARVTAILSELRPTTISASWAQLSDALRAGYDILYLVAHGILKSDQPWLYLVNAHGNADIKQGGAIADLLRSLGERRPRLVVLASCESAGDGYADALAALGPQLAQAGVPAVLAMQGKLSVDTNTRLAPVFFRELLRDGAIDQAVNAARLAVEDRHDWWMPVLYTRLRDGRLWESPAGVQANTPASRAAPNPFGRLGRIDDPAEFFGRDELLRRIFEELGKGSNLSLIGERQVGKSSLLAAIQRQGAERLGLPPAALLSINMQLIHSEEDFFDALCGELGLDRTYRGYHLDRRLRGKRYILCLDEIEKMRRDRFTADVRDELRGLADGAGAPLTLVIASSLPLDELFPDKLGETSPLNICSPLDVPPFTRAEARAFLADRLRDTGVAFDADEVAELLEQSGRHPGRLQQLAAELYRRKAGA
ncbi:CHAT domain-containing protein [Oscillochloris sp. ZM17-4]|uniref:CHAT domain-containing protein n=1 Tax=Oscillochloris sp. ZM17-4 TaxID=2866714 RepID=UPI001C730206|nr:CHAT domain-containing protein [Oscillochloris sp. ZM17-4]MBX0331486.1 CHAT domain-containing protein [Oscillochloris sp. ZM17-4]